MARFIVIHRLPEAATQDEVVAAGQAILTRLSDDARWLAGWVVPADDRLLCEWEASDAGAIRAVLEGINLFPTEAIHPVGGIDPAWFTE